MSGNRLQKLDEVEKEITHALKVSAQSLQELSREKVAQRNNQIENYTSEYCKSLQLIEQQLSEQISYLAQVSTGQPHEGSSYAAMKDVSMAHHRLEHARSRVSDLDRLKAEFILKQRPSTSQQTSKPLAPQQQQQQPQQQQHMQQQHMQQPQPVQQQHMQHQSTPPLHRMYSQP